MLTDEQFEKMREQASKAVDEALEFAESSPEPNVNDIMDGLYA